MLIKDEPSSSTYPHKLFLSIMLVVAVNPVTVSLVEIWFTLYRKMSSVPFIRIKFVVYVI